MSGTYDKYSMCGEISSQNKDVGGRKAITDITHDSVVYKHFRNAYFEYDKSKGSLIRYLKTKGFHTEKYSLKVLIGLYELEKQQRGLSLVHELNSNKERLERKKEARNNPKVKKQDNCVISEVVPEIKKINAGIVPFAQIVQSIRENGYCFVRDVVICYTMDKKIECSFSMSLITIRMIPVFLSQSMLFEIGIYADKKREVVEQYIINNQLIGGVLMRISMFMFKSLAIGKRSINYVDELGYEFEYRYARKSDPYKVIHAESLDIIMRSNSQVIFVPNRVFFGKLETTFIAHCAETDVELKTQVWMDGKLVDVPNGRNYLTFYVVTMRSLSKAPLIRLTLELILRGYAIREVYLERSYIGVSEMCIEFNDCIGLVSRNLFSFVGEIEYKFQKNPVILNFVLRFVRKIVMDGKMVIIRGHQLLLNYIDFHISVFFQWSRGDFSYDYCAVHSCDAERFQFKNTKDKVISNLTKCVTTQLHLNFSIIDFESDSEEEDV